MQSVRGLLRFRLEFEAADVLILLLLQNHGFRYIEALVITLIATITACFGFEIVLARPEILPLLEGFIPSVSIITDQEMLYISLGIIGARVGNQEATYDHEFSRALSGQPGRRIIPRETSRQPFAYSATTSAIWTA